LQNCTKLPPEELPANREKYREFCRIQRTPKQPGIEKPRVAGVFWNSPTRINREIDLIEQGKLPIKNREKSATVPVLKLAKR